MSSQPAGWYPNQQGQMQWWDGNAWGQVQQQTAAALPPPVYGAAPAYAGYGMQAPLPVPLQQGARLSGWKMKILATA